MLKNVSWAHYCMLIAIILVSYYASIVCLYYLNEIRQIISGRTNLFSKINLYRNHKRFKESANDVSIVKQPDERGCVSAGSADLASTEENLIPAVNQFMQDIKSKLEHAAETNLIKQEIIYMFQRLSQKYPLVHNSCYKSFINNYILIECSNYCSISLNEDELNMLWMK